MTGYVRRLQRRHPIPDAEQAWIIGLSWVVVTLGFEFGFGRLVAGLTWSELLADYDVSAGRIWGAGAAVDRCGPRGDAATDVAGFRGDRRNAE